MDWKEYEAITRYIYETLGKEYGVKIEGYGHTCKIKGKSGNSHQIDVLTSHSDGIHTYKTAIECKYWAERVNKDIVSKVYDIVEDAQLNKGVIVSKLGFTQDAINQARIRNIGLIELREMQEKDWEGRPRIIAYKSEVHRPEVLHLFIEPAEPMDEQKPIPASPLDVQIILRSGEPMKLTDLLTEFHKELRSQQAWIRYSLTYLFQGGAIYYTKLNITHRIKAITLVGRLLILPGPKFFPVDEIWLIMKNLFEGTTHTMSRLGYIQKDQSQAP